MRGQTEEARFERLSRGCCPTHGVPLTQLTGVWKKGIQIGELVTCPRDDCQYKVVIHPGSVLWKAVNGR